MGLLKEFREFAQKGNVVDLAVGVVIGGAFGKIVASLVNDVIMPPIGVLIGNVKFTDLKVVLRQAVEAAPGVEAVPAVTWNYGNFIQTVIEFLIIAWAVFILVKAINKLKRKPAPAPEEPKGPSAEELLTEIRDLLAKRG
jgi:large conductance mechanosensitive channel